MTVLFVLEAGKSDFAFFLVKKLLAFILNNKCYLGRVSIDRSSSVGQFLCQV